MTYDGDKVDDYYLQNLLYAVEAESVVEPLILVTRCRTIEQELDVLMKPLKGKSIDRFWIALEDPECPWDTYSPQENCQYLQDYVAKAGQLGLNMEFVILTKDWIQVFNDQTACP